MAATQGRPYGMIGMQERGHGMPCPYQRGRDESCPYIGIENAVGLSPNRLRKKACHSRESGSPGNTSSIVSMLFWIPACAGMTARWYFLVFPQPANSVGSVRGSRRAGGSGPVAVGDGRRSCGAQPVEAAGSLAGVGSPDFSTIFSTGFSADFSATSAAAFSTTALLMRLVRPSLRIGRMRARSAS